MGNPQSSQAFLGTGWAFPVSLDGSRAIAAVSDEEDVRQSIRIILGTGRGERVMRPDFGAGLHDFLFAPSNFATTEALRVRVEESLIDWEPRIELEQVSVVPAADDGSRLDIEVVYRVRSTNTRHNLVYPFYLEEGEGE
jgi:phage baseplate assembly protein W